MLTSSLSRCNYLPDPSHEVLMDAMLYIYNLPDVVLVKIAEKNSCKSAVIRNCIL